MYEMNPRCRELVLLLHDMNDLGEIAVLKPIELRDDFLAVIPVLVRLWPEGPRCRRLGS